MKYFRKFYWHGFISCVPPHILPVSVLSDTYVFLENDKFELHMYPLLFCAVKDLFNIKLEAIFHVIFPNL